jgi:hypothetical protein
MTAAKAPVVRIITPPDAPEITKSVTVQVEVTKSLDTPIEEEDPGIPSSLPILRARNQI